ncbi:carbohydrate ABC transporter permease [Actinomadura mexicana]|uniref:Carbohydrate ABC transporter membrane protein 2, CUT1 family n=1 Tax=Actinomadura mexicana TaxID=134959 RepID=A0A238XCF5_9ACTN|nr:carbohydrate ABC transporter permease [Actinomadura mexicana]SNR56380.1 carbohydrate ABC transporter membrane protein 2, CUT1 family [Actinomadura mexicana]
MTDRPSLITRSAGYTALCLTAVASLAPLVWVGVASLRDSTQITSHPLGLPDRPRWDNYVRAWTQAHFADYLGNSLLIAAGAVLVVLMCAVPAAYALSSLRLPLSRPLFVLFLLGLMIPIWSIIIPLFFQMRSAGLVNTRTGAILVEACLGLPFAIFMLRAFMQTIPQGIIDAARIDGAGNLRIIWSVVLPLARPTLQALTVFEFMWSWNEMVVPLFFLQDESVRTLPIGLTFFQGRFTSDTGVIAAGTTLAIVPVLAVYLLLNRQFIRGLTAGATK